MLHYKRCSLNKDLDYFYNAADELLSGQGERVLISSVSLTISSGVNAFCYPFSELKHFQLLANTDSTSFWSSDVLFCFRVSFQIGLPLFVAMNRLTLLI